MTRTGLDVDRPLNAGQDCRDIVRRAPPVLQNVQAQVSVLVDVRVEHLAYEFDDRGLRRILLIESEDEAVCAFGEDGIWRSEDDGIPAIL